MFSAVADSPRDDESEETCDTSAVTSRKTEEMSATDEVQSGLSRVSLRPLAVASPRSNRDLIKTTTSVSASSDNLMVHAPVSLYSSASVVTTEPCHKVAQQQAERSKSVRTPSNISRLSSEATGMPQNASGLGGSISIDRRGSSSPEIDILPVVRRARAASDYGSDNGGAGFGGTKSLQCTRSNAIGEYDMDTVEPCVSQTSERRCGSPGLGEDVDFSRRRLTHVPAVVAPSQSATAGGVKLIPLSQVMPTSPPASTSKHRSSNISRDVAEISTKATGNICPKSHTLSKPTSAVGEETGLIKLPKAGRRRSSRLGVPKSILGRTKQCRDDETKAVKFDVSVHRVEPTDKENVCMQTATEQQAVPPEQLPQHDSKECSHPSATPHTRSFNSSRSDDESEASSAEVRRSFIKCARLDVEDTERQRLPTSWERHTNKSPVSSRRMSGRIKRKEDDDSISMQQNDREQSPLPVTSRKRQASSSSSGLSSSEKKPAKKVVGTIAMTSLHSE